MTLNSKMAALTAPEPPSISWNQDGFPVSDAFGDIYFSKDGGLDESRTVFLQGCGLPGRWQSLPQFSICELGFGSGLNFLATWQSWKNSTQESQCLHYVSIEAHPWRACDLEIPYRQFPELRDLAAELRNAWPGPVKGPHRIRFGNVSLTLLHMDVDEALSNIDRPIDAWFLDGFSPGKNDKMWAPAVFSQMGPLSRPGAQVGTFTVAGHVRRGLIEAGFTVSKEPGFGRKRERLKAEYPGESTSTEDSPQSAIVIGGGIAGASVLRALADRGVNATLINKDTGLMFAASGNPAALVTPRLDLQDRPESRFYLSAYLFAQRAYKAISSIDTKGVIHLAKSPQEEERFRKIARAKALPAEQLYFVEANKAVDDFKLDFSPKFGGLVYPLAGIVDPSQAIARWTDTATKVNMEIGELNFKDGAWIASNRNGQEIARAPIIFVCAGADILNLLQLNVRFTKGQISWCQNAKSQNIPMNYGHYAFKYGDGILLGASHEHVGPGQENQLDRRHLDEVVDSYEGLTGKSFHQKAWKSRAAVRVTTKDTMPIAYQHEPGLFVLSGLGARGFMMAPLLAEQLVSEACGEMSPLGKDIKTRFGAREKPDPKRTRRR